MITAHAAGRAADDIDEIIEAARLLAALNDAGQATVADVQAALVAITTHAVAAHLRLGSTSRRSSLAIARELQRVAANGGLQ